MTRTQVVILGGGFAGISTAKELGRFRKKGPPLDVHLINNENYFVFQPLLPEVISCGIEPSHILNPIRHLCPFVNFHYATVKSIDLKNQIVQVEGNDIRQSHGVPYDHLIITLGLTMNVSMVPGMAEHTFPLKTMGDAFHLRNHILSKLEEADIESDETRRKTALTFVAIGGGFSGVETMAAINDMVKAVLPYYPRVQRTGCRMVLIHSGDHILAELDRELGSFAQQQLQKKGVEILLNRKVKEATPLGVVIDNEEKLAAETVVCTVGNAPHPIMATLDLPQERGRLVTGIELKVKGTTNVWALGDAALIPDIRSGGFWPPTAQYAMRQGRQCARNIVATLEGKPAKPFQFGGLGQMAVVGRHWGVAQIFGLKISGFLAWCLWRGAYLIKLPGLPCKVRVGIDWALELLFPRDITKIELQRTEQLKHAHFQKGEIIIRQGEIGDRFYIIESGKVEVVRQEPGKPEECLAIRSAGDSFGELALLKDAPRAATVRCLTPVDVIMFNRNDFMALAGSYGLFKTQMEKEVTTISQFWVQEDRNKEAANQQS